MSNYNKYNHSCSKNNLASNLESSICEGVSSHIHLALSPWNLTDDYNRHAGVTLLSFLDHCPEYAKVTAHLLYDKRFCVGKEKETEYNKWCYQLIADRYNCELIYHHVDLPEWVNDIPAVKKWTPGTLMRLCLPDLLPDVDKILYLDCDMVVLTDIGELWNTKLGSKYLAACIDEWIMNKATKQRMEYYEKVSVPLKNYFNAGLLLLNLKLLREQPNPFSSTLFSYLHDNPELPFLDQDLLNWYCKGDYILLDKKYDVFPWWKDAIEYTDDCIIHYTIGKPWKMYNGDIDNFYWKYLFETPWSEDLLTYLHYVRDAPDIQKSISLIQKNFFGIIDGSRVDKVKCAVSLSFSIWSEFIIGILKIVRSKIHS